MYQFIFLTICTYLLHNGICAEETEKDYANIPDLFHYDNFDRCMLLGDDARYCSLSYELQPLNNSLPSESWLIIKNLTEVETNYNHSRLRYRICINTACPGILRSEEDASNFKRELEQCLDDRFREFGLKGTIPKVSCVTGKEPKHPVDALDAFVGVVFLSYVLFVLFATARVFLGGFDEKSSKLINIFSVTESWTSLRIVKSTPDVEKLRCIQGLRVYNSAVVLLVHSSLTFIALPVANIRVIETITGTLTGDVLASGLFGSSVSLVMVTFFFISSFLLSNSVFSSNRQKKLNLKYVLSTIRKRFYRLTPSVLTVVMFHSTLLRHLTNGPNWDFPIEEEFRRCRRNWWTNIIYINNWKDPSNMCLQVTWFLGRDVEYLFVMLALIWLVQKYEKKAYWIFGTAIFLNAVATFTQNYYHNFPAIVWVTPETYYELQYFKEFRFQRQYSGFISNLSGPLVGLMFGYYFSNRKNDKKFFNTKARRTLWWCLSWGLISFWVVVVGKPFINKSIQHTLWASLYVALSRPLFAFAIGVLVCGVAEGLGGVTKKVLELAPIYVLGRLTFSVYLIHTSIMFLRMGTARYPPYVSQIQIVLTFIGDMSISFAAALLLTLFVEIPFEKLTQRCRAAQQNNMENGNIAKKRVMFKKLA